MELLKKENDSNEAEIWVLEEDGKLIFFRRELEWGDDYHSLFEVDKAVLENFLSIKSTAFDVISNILKE